MITVCDIQSLCFFCGVRYINGWYASGFRSKITREFRVGLPWELLYADDLVVIEDIEEEMIRKLNIWRESLKKKGLRVNLSNTKLMVVRRGVMHR